MSAMTRDYGDRRVLRATALCLRPSAMTPPPIDVLLKTKGKPQFDRAVTERSKALFYVFQQSNPAQFQPVFSVLTVRSAEGRNFSKSRGAKFAAPSNCHRSCRRPKAGALSASRRGPA